LDRRTTIKWVLAASAALPLLEGRSARAGSPPAGSPPSGLAPAQGYGTDPNLVTTHRPGEFWPLTLSAPQRRLAGILADIILPADEHSPSASAVGVVEFIDEWFSAPYPAHQRDRTLLLGGLAWMAAEAAQRFGKGFADLESAEQRALCDDICDQARAAPARRDAAHFFARFRDLTAGGFYTTPAGRKDLQYIGNVPLTRFDGPPPALLKSLGLL
jgi:hypothetical protein